MSIESEIEALVARMVDDLVELIHVAAVTSLEQAFEEVARTSGILQSAPRTPSKSRGSAKELPARSSSKPSKSLVRARTLADQPSKSARAARAVESTKPKELAEDRDEPVTAGASEGPSLAIWPKAPDAASSPPAPPVVRRFPPKRARTRRSAPVTNEPRLLAETGPREPTPAKSWIVRRRGATERGPASAESATETSTQDAENAGRLPDATDSADASNSSHESHESHENEPGPRSSRTGT